MDDVIHNIRSHAVAILGTSGSWLGVVLANREAITFWLQSLSYVGAIAVSLVTIWSILKKHKK